MASGLGDDENESQLLRVHWLMVYDALPANWKRYQTIKERFNLKSYYQRHTELLADLVDYLESLRNTVMAYCDIYSPHRAGAFNEFSEPALRLQIIEAQDKLVRAGVRATFLPLLVAVRLKAHDDGNTYLHVLELCEKFDFRIYQWLRARASSGQTIFFRLGNQFYKRPDVDSVVASITRTLVEYCTNARFEEKFSRETEDWYHWYGLKYFLYEYEQHLAAQEREPMRMHWDVLTDTKRDTIEHILPQTPTKTWLEAFPDELRRKRWMHDIGNLTLTFDNSSLQNKSFQEKKGEPSLPSCYAGSSFFVERQLVEYPRWTEVELLQRREQIKAWALARWHVDEESATVPKVDDLSERIMLMAEDGGVLNEYLALIKFATDHKIHLRAFQKSMMMGATVNHTIALGTIRPREDHLDVWIGFTALEEYQHIPRTKPQEIFETEKMDWHEFVNSANLADFLEKMERLFD